MKLWQAFFEFFLTVLAGNVSSRKAEFRPAIECRNPLSMRAEGDNPVTIPCRQYGVEINSSGYLFPGVACLTSWGGSRYFFSRTALNVPSFDGPSPTSGENSTSPVIKSAVSNFPLHVNVPASRPTLPRRNSTGPENVTEFPSPRVHFASEGLTPAQTLDCGSVTVKSAFSVALCIKAQETVLLASKSNLDLPTASHVRRLCLGQDEGECVHDHCQNYCARCFHVFF